MNCLLDIKVEIALSILDTFEGVLGRNFANEKVSVECDGEILQYVQIFSVDGVLSVCVF